LIPRCIHSRFGDGKALKKLTGPRLPGSLRRLETAVKRAHEDCARAERAADESQHDVDAVDTAGQPTDDPTEDVVAPEVDVEDSDDEHLAEPAAD
jgi:hypothetical protein